jgi:hypothetical protein
LLLKEKKDLQAFLKSVITCCGESLEVKTVYDVDTRRDVFFAFCGNCKALRRINRYLGVTKG